VFPAEMCKMEREGLGDLVARITLAVCLGSQRPAFPGPTNLDVIFVRSVVHLLDGLGVGSEFLHLLSLHSSF